MGNGAKYGFAIMLMFILLAACSQKTPVEQIYQVLEKVVSAEKGFENQQAPLMNLEKKEKTVYDQIMGLGMKHYDEIVKLSNEAISIAEERKTYIDKETASISESEKEFKEMAKYKDGIQDKKLKKEANELYTLMMQRYKAHDELYKAYLKGIAYDEQLYKMFQDKNLSAHSLQNQIDKVNASYREIYAANDQFNKWTMQYNDKKMQFYKAAGIQNK